nr:hypothetical protein [Tanacetum cinerariifolium]
MIADRQPAEEELGAEQVQVDATVAAAVVEDVVEDVAEDVAHVATPSPPPHGIPSPPQEPFLPPQQPHVTPPAPTQVEAFLATFKQLRRLRKVEASRQVESFDDMEDVFNQGRMMNEDEGIELVKDAEIAESEGRQADKQAKIYNIDLDHSSKVLKVVTTAKLITKVVTAAASQVSAASTTIPAASATIPAANPTISAVAPIVVAAYTRRRKGDKGKGIMVEAPNPMKKKDQIEMDAEYARMLQEEIDKDHDRFNKDRYQGMKKRPQTESGARKNMMIYLKNTVGYKMVSSREEMEEEDQEIIKSINETPAQKAAKRRKLSEEAQEAKDLRKRLEVVEDKDDDVFAEATPLASKVPVVDYQIVLIDNKPRFKIIRADETHQFYISFVTLLKNFDREDLETLWRIVKDRFSTSKPTNFSNEYLLLTLKTMFKEPDGQDAIWRNQKSVHGLALVKRWKLLTSCGVHIITLSTV